MYYAIVHYLPCSGKFSDSPEQPGRRRRSKRRFSSLTNLTDLTSAKKASGGRRRRNSISLDDIQNLKRFPPKDWDWVLIPFSLTQVVPWKRRRTFREHFPSIHVWNQQEVLSVYGNQSKGEDRVGSFALHITVEHPHNDIKRVTAQAEEAKVFITGLPTTLR